MTKSVTSLENNSQEFYFWDMDHTIIKNDCDVSWKEFLVKRGTAPQDALQKADDFYQDYLDNCLDQDEFMDFQLAEFAGQSESEMDQIAQEHFDEIVRELIYPEAEATIRRQLAEGKRLCLITATNTVIAKPLAKYLGIENVIASELEFTDGTYTGKRTGIYCLGQGKVDLMKILFEDVGGSLDQSHYYGDSSADIVILEQVAFPHAVNPGEKLLAAAKLNDWDIIEFNL
jgi:HAD superfamily hydrolase (TIGR01490 family)